jgi:uncharacterized Zn finger protein
MTIKLTEQTIRDRASDQSYQKGRDYYQSDAIYNPAWQSAPGGVVLMANCEGSTVPSYRLRIELDEGGIRSASCTCPYDWGGDCKHIVALLLLYLNKPDEFSQQKSVSDLLAGLEKDALVAIIHHLVGQNPDAYEDLEIAVLNARAASQPKSASGVKRQTQVSEQAYRKQITKILKRSRYDERSYYDDYGSTPEYVDNLEKIRQTGVQFLEAGDAEGALIILRILLEETTEDYDGDMDYDGDLACVIQDIGMPLAESILSADLDAKERETLANSMEEIYDNLDETIEESELAVVLLALEHGWDELPDPDTEWDEYEEEDWMDFDALQNARLNVLERQGRADEFLKLAEKANPRRYVLKLLKLDCVDDAITACENLSSVSEMLDVAKKLCEAGRLDAAISLAERGLNINNDPSTAAWLAPLEESQGRTDMALRAYRIAFEAQPSIERYRHLKRLAGPGWDTLRPQLVKKAGQGHMKNALVDIHLEEKEWDAAIVVAERETWSTNLLEVVADKLVAIRPDWVIRVSLKQSDALILKTKSNLYPEAAKWLARAQKAYQHKGQMADWQAYISNLRATYARRPALQRELAGL